MLCRFLHTVTYSMPCEQWFLQVGRNAPASQTASNRLLLWFGDARVSSGKLCAGVAKIWLFGSHSACSFIQPKRFASFISTSSRKFCASSELELKKLTEPLKNFQVSKALVVAAEQIPLNVFLFTFLLQVCFWEIYDVKLKFSFILGYFV